MARRLMMWAGVGFALVVAWAIYAAIVPMYAGSLTPLTLTVLALTCPIAYASLALQFPLQLVWALILNAATFAFIGTLLETLRWSTRHA